MTTTTFESKKASRKQSKIKIGLAGPSGSGKTTAALLIAYGITKDWSKIGVVDTENRSSELYVGMKFGATEIGAFETVQFPPPFGPERYCEAMDIHLNNPNIEVLIVDSMSHEWDGKGGVLDLANAMTGNSFTNWAKLTPRHNKFIDKIVQSNKHIICTMRSKQDYVLMEKNGKQVPEKVGLKAITREGVDYEFTLCFDIDIKHNAASSKDRTGLFMDKPEFVISSSTGEVIKKWCETGEDYIEPAKELPAIGEKALKQSLKRINDGDLAILLKVRAAFTLTPEQDKVLTDAHKTQLDALNTPV